MATPKSKEARRKIRRWHYDVRVIKDDQQQIFQAQALTIGTPQDARETAKTIREDLSKTPQFEGCVLSVTPIGHETVSRTLLAQFTGLQDELRLYGQVIKKLITDQVTGELAANTLDPYTNVDDEVKTRIGQAIIDTRNALIAEQQSKAEEIAKSLGGEIVNGEIVIKPTEESQDTPASELESVAVTAIQEQELELTDPKVGDALEAAFNQAAERLNTDEAEKAA